jgi:O-antigen ligase
VNFHSRLLTEIRTIFCFTAITILVAFGPFTFTLGGINTSAIEMLSILVFGLTVATGITTRDRILTGYLVLLVASIIPLTIGIVEFGLVRSCRDFAGTIYMSYVFGGIFLAKHNILNSHLMLKLIWIATAIIALLYILEKWVTNTAFFEGVELKFRIFAALTIVSLFAKAYGIKHLPQLSALWVYVILLIVSIFVLQLRTRALYLMIIVGIGVVMLRQATLKEQISLPWKMVFIITSTILSSIVYLLMSDLSFIFQNVVNRTSVLFSQDYARDISTNYRLIAWEAALLEITESPIVGMGFGKYTLLDPWVNGELRPYPSYMIHNQWIQFLYNGGLLYFGGIIYFFRTVFPRDLSIDKSQHNASMALITIAFSLGFFTYSFFGVTFSKPTDAFIFWVIVGVLQVTSHPGYNHTYLGNRAAKTRQLYQLSFNDQMEQGNPGRIEK